MAERVGFEPTVPCGITSFQDWLLKPLGHLSKQKALKAWSLRLFGNSCTVSCAASVYMGWIIGFEPMIFSATN